MIDSVEFSASQKSKDYCSVSEAMNLAKGALEQVVLKVVGEVSELSIKKGYSAVYFTIKDDGAVMPCKMWFNRYQQQDAKLELGALVELTGRFSLYPKNGRMSFDVFSLSLAGEGNLRLQVANLAKKLAAEGLMDEQNKLPLPQFPEKIGLVTSPRGAVVHDVLRTLRRRFPLTKVYFAGVPVEGKQAAAQIADGMRLVYKQGVELILIVRGGGSFEDLMPFNDEALARAISACPLPIVTGIGHEPDTTIADMVADRRASTPTAAAEAISPDADLLFSYFREEKRALGQALSASFLQNKLMLDRYAHHSLFNNSMFLFSDKALELDSLQFRINNAIPHNIKKDEVKLSVLGAQLQTQLNQGLKRYKDAHDKQKLQLKNLSQSILTPYQSSFKVYGASLHSLSPLATLDRGYGIVRNDEGIVTSVKNLKEEEKISVVLADGIINAKVTSSNTIKPQTIDW